MPALEQQTKPQACTIPCLNKSPCIKKAGYSRRYTMSKRTGLKILPTHSLCASLLIYLGWALGEKIKSLKQGNHKDIPHIGLKFKFILPMLFGDPAIPTEDINKNSRSQAREIFSKDSCHFPFLLLFALLLLGAWVWWLGCHLEPWRQLWRGTVSALDCLHHIRTLYEKGLVFYYLNHYVPYFCNSKWNKILIQLGQIYHESSH